MVDVVEIAKEKLEKLEKQASELRKFIALYSRLSGDSAEDDEAPFDDDSSESGTYRRTASPSDIVESATLEMRERNHPLTRSQIVKYLTKRGLNLPGADKNKNVGTVIWRSDKFDNIPGEGYWPKSFDPWHPASSRKSKAMF